MDHQDSYGCRRCSNGYNLCPLPGASLRRRRRPQTAGRHRASAGAAAPGHGRGYEDNQTLQLALDFGFIPVIPPRANRLEPWQYDKAMYRRRNEIERLFRRLKGFRRIFSRFDKLDVVFLAFLYFALIVEALRFLNSVNTP